MQSIFQHVAGKHGAVLCGRMCYCRIRRKRSSGQLLEGARFTRSTQRAIQGFHLRMQAEVLDLVIENGTVMGVCAKTPEGPLEVRASLTVGADGRHSVVRQKANFKIIDLGAPMDVLWMPLSRRPGDSGQTFGHAEQGKLLLSLLTVAVDRLEEWSSTMRRTRCRPSEEFELTWQFRTLSRRRIFSARHCEKERHRQANFRPCSVEGFFQRGPCSGCKE